jgi:DNA-binding MarR family transcriptional regulator
MTLQLTDTVNPGPASRRSRGRPAKPGGLALGPLPALIGFNLRKAQAAIFHSFQDAVAPHDVTPGQFGVLVMIRENEGLSQSDLGNAVGIDRSTMVAVIDRLEARGLVIRAPSPHDRRSYALRLSPQGHSLMDELIPRVEAHDRSMAQELSKQEQAQLIDFMRRIARTR